MKTIREIQEELDKYKPVLYAKYPIKRMGIFGSYARNQATEESDLDILVEFNEPIGLDFVALANDLEEKLGMKVDLVSSNALKPALAKYVAQDLINV